MVHQAFWRKERVVDSTHLGMRLGMELFVSPFPDVVAAAKPVTDAKQHVLVAQLEKVWTGHVLLKRYAGHPMRKQIPHVLPLAFEGG